VKPRREKELDRARAVRVRVSGSRTPHGLGGGAEGVSVKSSVVGGEAEFCGMTANWT